MQSREVKVSQTGNVVWSQVDNSVSIGRYRQRDADRSARSQLSEQSPETQTEWERERERVGERRER